MCLVCLHREKEKKRVYIVIGKVNITRPFANGMPEGAERDNLAEILKDTVTVKYALKELGKRGYGSVQVVGIEGKILKIEAREEEFAVVTADGMTGIHPYGTMMMYIPQKAADKPDSP